MTDMAFAPNSYTLDIAWNNKAPRQRKKNIGKPSGQDHVVLQWSHTVSLLSFPASLSAYRKKECDKENAILKVRRAQQQMAWAAACCKGEEASLCCCKGSLTKMSDSGSQESKQWLILGLNSQVKVWYNTHPRKKQICRGNTLTWCDLCMLSASWQSPGSRLSSLPTC